MHVNMHKNKQTDSEKIENNYFWSTAAAAAKLLQSWLTVWPHRQQPTRLPRPWNSPGKNTGVGCHILLQCMKVKSESEVAQSCPTLSDPTGCSLPGSSILGFSRQEYWSGVPLTSPFEVLDIRIKWQWSLRDGNLVEFQVFPCLLLLKCLMLSYGEGYIKKKKAQ